MVMCRCTNKASTFAFLGIFASMVGIPISVGLMASIPNVRANDDIPVNF